MLGKKFLFGGTVSTGIRPQDVFKIVRVAGNDMQAEIDAWQPDLIFDKEINRYSRYTTRDVLRGMTLSTDFDNPWAEYTFTGYSSEPYLAWMFKKHPASLDIKLFNHSEGVNTQVTFDLNFNVGLVAVRRRAGGPWMVWQLTMGATEYRPDEDFVNKPYTNPGILVSGKTVTVRSTNGSGAYLAYAFADNADIHKFGLLQVNSQNQGQQALPWLPQFLHIKNTAIDAVGQYRYAYSNTTAETWPMNQGYAVSASPDLVHYTALWDAETPLYWMRREASDGSVNTWTSSSMSGTGWSTSNGAVVTSPTTLSMGGTVGSTVQYTGLDAAAGDTLVYEVTLSGSGSVVLGVREVTPASVTVESSKVVALSATPTVYCVGRLFTTATADGATGGVFLRRYNGPVTCTATGHRAYNAKDASNLIRWDGQVQDLALSTQYSSNLEFTNGNKTIRNTSVSFARAKAAGEASTVRSTGKWAYECYIDSMPQSDGSRFTNFGWIRSDKDFSSGDYWLGLDSKSIGFTTFAGHRGGWQTNAPSGDDIGTVKWPTAPQGFTIASGDRVQVFIDFDRERVYITKDGIYYWDGDTQRTRAQVEQGLGVNIYSAGLERGPLLPIVNIEIPTSKVTVNFGTPVLAPYPSGFQSLGNVSVGNAPTTFINTNFLTWAIRAPT